MSSSEFQLGQLVLYSHYLRRGGLIYPRREWEPVQLPHEQQGVVVGKRTLMNLDCPWEYDTGIVPDLSRATRFTAYLVAYDLQHNPVRVLPEHLRVIGPR